ncbi:galactose mutarotase-like protein [Aulographum hederae CBS 113979]|uniref:Galactose mutarotase-like protein n=1 Tax=Aulographum hederae CBS 113979 TaxID=1176131 RepID=A0A6G1GT86_9PEZI|nr:galactose mutarotase-like protein [Aulographum hederae CBS 113979]
MSSFTFLPTGAIIQEFLVDGTNIVQGFPTTSLYHKYANVYYGETIGRVANRIANARIENLNNRTYELAANDVGEKGSNTLHGGKLGWGERVFEGPIPVNKGGKEAVLFKRISADGEEGFPGTVEVRVWYIASKETDKDGKEITQLEVEYEAEMVGDENPEETVVALTNHSYFNLTDGETIEGTEVTLATNKYLPVDETNIPTGAIEEYPDISANTPFLLGKTEPDIDNCFLTHNSPTTVPIDTRALPLHPLASLFHPTSKIHLEIASTEPAFQFYTGKYIDIPDDEDEATGQKVKRRGPRSGFCVEPSRWVNAVNVGEWRGMVVLGRGKVYGARSVYRAWRG